MPVTLDNAEENRPLNQENAETNDNQDSCVVCTLNAITVNVFFDGTGNNMFNTQHRLDDEKLIDEEYQKRQIPTDISEEKKNSIREQIRQEITPYGNLKDQISYENDLSNVALLYNAAEVEACIKRVYIEGAGTIKDQADDQGGLAAATGESGIMDRVFDAFSQIRKQIKEQSTNMIIFNIFGFSRGSFYGRYFAAVLKESFTEQDKQRAEKEATKKEIAAQKRAEQNQAALEKRRAQQQNPPSAFSRMVSSAASTIGNVLFAPVTAIKKIVNNKLPIFESLPILTNDYARQCNGRGLLDYQPAEITINLVGIYDTVSSHGWDHHNDSIDFKLDIGDKQKIKKIIHLTAANEYRNHFALVTTNTAIKDRNSDGKPVGFQCSIPGAHADIGGGYIKKWEEKNYFLSNYDKPETTNFFTTDAGEVNWRWFRDKGYYGYGSATSTYSQIAKTRKAINEIEQEITNLQAKVAADQATNNSNSANQQALVIAQEKLAVTNKQLKLLYEQISPSDSSAANAPAQAATTIDQDPVLLRQDGYRAGDFIVEKAWALNLQSYYKVRGTRQFTENAYQYVALKMMHQMAKHQYINALQFTSAKGEKDLTKAYNGVNSDPFLAKFCNYAVNTALNNYEDYTKDMLKITMNGVLSDKEQRYLYHNFIHNSLQSEFTLTGIANYFTNGSRDYNKDTNFNPVRVIVYDNQTGVQNTVKDNPYTNPDKAEVTQ